jgi:hypothetical protein
MRRDFQIRIASSIVGDEPATVIGNGNSGASMNTDGISAAEVEVSGPGLGAEEEAMLGRQLRIPTGVYRLGGLGGGFGGSSGGTSLPPGDEE